MSWLTECCIAFSENWDWQNIEVISVYLDTVDILATKLTYQTDKGISNPGGYVDLIGRNAPVDFFLHGISTACHAEPCISYGEACEGVCLFVCLSRAGAAS